MPVRTRARGDTIAHYPKVLLMRIASSLALLWMLMTCVGCSNVNLQKPTAAFKDVSITGINEKGFTMNFDVELANPNDVELPLTAADYGLTLGDVKIMEGKANPGGSIPAKGSSRVMLPVAVTYENLLSAEKFIRQSGGNVPYKFTGGLNAGQGLPLLGNALRIPLEYDGKLNLAELLKDPMLLMRSEAARTLAKKALGSMLKF